MKTKIILSREYKRLYETDKQLNISSGDIITLKGIEYCVKYCHLDIDDNVMEIHVKPC